MQLTGKANTDFYIWLEAKMEVDHAYNDYLDSHYIPDFVELPDAMRFSVYVDFFDSKDLRIFVDDNIQSHAFNGTYSERLKLARFGFEVQHDNFGSFYHLTRSEARTAAIEKANEIYNAN